MPPDGSVGKSMLPKPRRPREKRIVPLARAAYTIKEFCDKTGLSEEEVLRSIDDGSLRIVKIGTASVPGSPFFCWSRRRRTSFA